MGKSGASVIKYKQGPNPFAVPVIWEKSAGPPAISIPRETLKYSSKALEEIMFYIDKEYERREITKPQWKRYKNSTTEFEVFAPDAEGGRNLVRMPLKWFPQIVKDIQNAIDALIADPKVHDTRAAFLARVFCNNVTGGFGNWNNNTKLVDGIIVPFRKDGNSTRTLNPLTRAKSGLWPFEDDYVENALLWVGITPGGTVRVKSGPKGIETTDPNWPSSDIGIMTPSGAAGIVTPMTASNRPVMNRINVSNTSQGAGAGLEDRDEGYGYIGHPALVIQQLRWQPPIIEWWPNNVPIKDYVSNLFSNQTPNLNWYFQQQVETTFPQNWGTWLIKGYAGVSSNSLLLRVYDDPMVQSGELGFCLGSVFFPPPEVHCACGFGSSAYAMWWSNDFPQPLWDDMAIPVTGGDAQSTKFFGKNTRLRIKYTLSAGAGQNVVKTQFLVGIKTSRIGIIDVPYTYISTINAGSSSAGTIDINIMEELRKQYPSYPLNGIDGIMSMQILLQTQTSKQWTATTVYFPTGSAAPSNAKNLFKCENPDVTVRINYIELSEVAIQGDPVTAYP